MRLALIFNGLRPGTTGMHFARALEQLGVATDHWELSEAHRIPPTYALYLRVDHGDDYLVRLPGRLRPAVFYAIDTHLPNSWKKVQRTAGWYDMVFCCHRDGAERLRGAVWLPVACNPELHASRREAPLCWDVAFIGTDGGVPRKFYLQAMRERYPRSFIGAAEHSRIGAVYGRARVGFNYAIANDINMRVFEVLAGGALLVTNALRHDDLERLGLRDREHLVLYRTPGELFDTIDHYLVHEEDRERIAQAGSRLALTRHTYAHRMRALLVEASRRLGMTLLLPLEGGSSGGSA